MIELWYSFVIIPFCGYHFFLLCELDLVVSSCYCYASEIEDRWQIVFVLFDSVILSSSENLTLLITFEQYVLELWYFTWVIIVTRPFRTYQYFFTLWPWPWSLTYFKKTFLIIFEQWVLELCFLSRVPLWQGLSVFFTLWPWPCSITLILKRLILLIIFEQWGLELWYFTRVIILTRPFYGYQQFWSMALTYKDGLLFENLNLVYNFWTVKVRAVRFHMNIPYDKV